MSPLQPVSHHDILAKNQKHFEEGLRNGSITPFVYPMGTYGAAVLLLFLLIPPRSLLHSKFTRYMAFAMVMYWHVWLISHCKAYHPPNDFGVGMLSAWGTLWAATLLIFRDSKVQYKRIESHSFRYSIPEPNKVDQRATDDSSATSQDQTTSAIRHRNMSTKPISAVDKATNGAARNEKSEHRQLKQTMFHWRHYPSVPFIHRLEWVIDLVTNFRGVGWNWKVPGLPSYPANVQRDLQSFAAGHDSPYDYATSRSGVRRFDNYRSVILHNIWLFIKGYMALDALKTAMNHDPYFWGLVDQPPPSYYPNILHTWAFFRQSYRLTISMCMVWVCLRTIFCVGPLLFVGLFGTKYLGVNGEPWLYPDHFGSFMNILERGLAGWWGGWWHQSFRYTFQTGGEWTAAILGLHKDSMRAKIVQLFVAFALSGFLHASGSITQLGETYPWSGSFLFFVCQPVGMLLEVGWKQWLRQSGYADRIPKYVAWLANFAYANLWLLMTAPLLMNDFARGGIWLFEPIMFSPLRGLGFGVKGDGFLCWDVAHWIRWHQNSQNFWLSGFVF